MQMNTEPQESKDAISQKEWTPTYSYTTRAGKVLRGPNLVELLEADFPGIAAMPVDQRFPEEMPQPPLMRPKAS